MTEKPIKIYIATTQDFALERLARKRKILITHARAAGSQIPPEDEPDFPPPPVGWDDLLAVSQEIDRQLEAIVKWAR